MATRLPIKDEYVTLTPLNKYQIDILATYYMESFSKLKYIYVAKNAWEAQLTSITSGLDIIDVSLDVVEILSVTGTIKLVNGLPKHWTFEREEDL